MSKADNLKDFLIDLANAIREKINKTGAINPQNFSAEILSIIAGDVQMPNVSGTLVITEGITEEDYEALKLVLGNNITIDAQGGIYIHFEDPEVLRVLFANGVGDGIGITAEAAEKVKTIGTWFKGNTAIKTFDEFEKFSGVKEIISDSFRNCSALESLTLPKGLTKINQASFANNTVLKHIGLPESLTYISNSSGIDQSVMEFEDINLPNLTYLGAYAFKNTKVKKVSNLGKITEIAVGYPFNNCPELEEVNLPTTVTRVIGFGNCTKLRKINLDNVKILGSLGTNPLLVDVGSIDNVETLDRAALQKNTSLIYDISNMNKVKVVSDSCFYQTPITGVVNWPLLTATENSWNSMLNTVFRETNITGIESLGSEIVKIGDSMCMDCKSLQYVNIPTSVKTILENAFVRCTSLTEVNGLDNVTIIRASAFNGCSVLSNIDSIAKVEVIEGSAFSDCSALSIELNMPNLQTLGGNVFLRSGITKIVNLGKITTIPGSTFENCLSLTEATINEGITSIDYNCFRGCTALVTLNLPSTLTSLNNIVPNCTSLEYINAENVTSVVGFSGCKSLRPLPFMDKITTWNGSMPESLNWEVFHLPICTSVMNQIGRVNTTGITTAILPAVTTLDKYWMYNKTTTYIYLRDATSINEAGIFNRHVVYVIENETPANMTYSQAFGYFNVAYAKIYIPDSALQTYATATNWSAYYNNGQIKGISQLATDEPEFYAILKGTAEGYEDMAKWGYLADW